MFSGLVPYTFPLPFIPKPGQTQLKSEIDSGLKYAEDKLWPTAERAD